MERQPPHGAPRSIKWPCQTTATELHTPHKAGVAEGQVLAIYITGKSSIFTMSSYELHNE